MAAVVSSGRRPAAAVTRCSRLPSSAHVGQADGHPALEQRGNVRRALREELLLAVLTDRDDNLNTFLPLRKHQQNRHDDPRFNLQNDPLDYYLANPDEAHAIGENARRRALAEHTLRHRLDEMLSVLGV